MKQSKFIKDFKDLRSYAFDELVRTLVLINSKGRFNCFNLSFLNVPLQGNLDQAHTQMVMLELYLKEQEKQAMWKNLTFSHKEVAGGDQDDHPDIQQSAEYKTFESLFNLMNGPAKIRLISKEKLLRPFSKLFE
jgi:hypothetical protein